VVDRPLIPAAVAVAPEPVGARVEKARAAVTEHQRSQRPGVAAAPRTCDAPATRPARSPRPSRAKRIGLTLLAAAAAFIIVFEFLALQLQASNPAGGSGAAPVGTTAARAAHGTPIVSRTSGASTGPVGSSATTGAAAAPTASPAHHRSHAIATSASGVGMRSRGESDDL
jgi:hypothetical protein